MTDQSPVIGSFAGGEITPYMNGRTDHSRYYVSLRIGENVITLPQGPAERRGGRRFIAEVKNSADAVRLLKFKFSNVQAYAIEAGPGYFRFCMNKAQILAGGVPYELATPYGADDLADLRLCQSYDVVWITHPRFAPRKLSRSSHTNWTLTVEDFADGPYLDENTTDTVLVPAAISGAGVAVTASATTGINDGQGFLPSDVGRLIRIGHACAAWVKDTDYGAGATVNASGYAYRCTQGGHSSATVTLSGTGVGIADGTCLWKQIGSMGIGWGYGRIVTYGSPTHVAVDVVEPFVTTDACDAWRLGLWSETTGWPTCATFHQDRLWYGSATASRPHRLDGSATGDFANFAPGTNDADAIAVSIGSDDVAKIMWLASARVLLVGTVGGEYVVSADTTTASLTPTNINAVPHTLEGCAAIAPVKTGGAVLFGQLEGRKVHELKYDLNVDGYVAPELTLFADQATEGGVVDIDWAKQPWSIVWIARGDGELTGCTYLPAQEVAGFHRHPADGAVESLTVIPGSSGSNELWLLVNHVINGQNRRYIEVQEDPLPLNGKQADAFYVDAGLSLINSIAATLTPTAATGDGVSFTAGADVFAATDVGREIHHDYRVAAKVDGRTVWQWTKARARIVAVADARHVTANVIVDFPNVAAIEAGDWRLTVTEVSGLDHLEGRTVQALLDGGVQADKVVTNGRIDLDWPASKVHVGLQYVTVIAPMPLELGAATKRIEELRLRLLRSLGGWVGRDQDSLEQILYRSITDPLDAPPPLFTGDKTVSFPGDWTTVGDILMVQDLPLPFTISATIPTAEVSVA